ncbi:putative membrane protein, partial [Chlamydia psittaci 10_743_SC13]
MPCLDLPGLALLGLAWPGFFLTWPCVAWPGL